jgi:hypothetical protein
MQVHSAVVLQMRLSTFFLSICHHIVATRLFAYSINLHTRVEKLDFLPIFRGAEIFYLQKLFKIAAIHRQAGG